MTAEWMRPSLMGWLNVREDPRVQFALTRTCRICKAVPGCDCRNPRTGELLRDRIIHLDRAGDQ